MNSHLQRFSVVIGLVLFGSLISVLPAQAEQTPTVSVDDGVVEYVDPALAHQDSERVRGTLRMAYVDALDGSKPEVENLYAIETSDGERIPVALGQDLPVSATNGSIVADLVDDGSDQQQVQEATVEPEPATAQGSSSGRVHQVYVAMPTTSGALPDDTQVKAGVATMGDEWTTESEGGISSIGVAKIVRYASKFTKQQLCQFHSSAASVYSMWDEAAKKAGWANYYTPPSNSTIDHLVLVLSGTDSQCQSYGGGTLGIGVVGAGVDTDGTALSVSWRSNQPIRESTLIHEMGHNFGLGHGDVHTTSGELKSYYDLYSVMGFGMTNGSAPALDSAFRDQLGFTRSGEVVTIDAGRSGDQTITLAPRGTSSGTRAVKVVDSDGRSYWIELRSAVARDTGAIYDGVALSGSPSYTYESGVTVTRLEDQGANAGELLLHVQGAADGKVRTSYAAGQTFTSPTQTFHVRVDSIGNGKATVTVTGKPFVVGHQQVGANLYVRGYAAGATRQWMRDGYAVRGQTGTKYALTGADRGARISVVVSGPDGSVESDPTWRIAAGRLVTKTPKVTGSAKKGKTLKVVTGWGTAPVAYTYQWYANGVAIKGATRATYTVSKAYVSKKIRVRVVGSKTGYTSVAKYSGYTAKIKK